MRRVVLALAFLLGSAASARAEGEKAKPQPAHTDKQAADALAAFATGFASEDMDVRLKAVRTLGKWRHKDVLKELKRILTREEDLELKAAAAECFAFQTAHTSEAGRAVADALKEWDKWATIEEPKDKRAEERQKDEEDVLVALWGSAGVLAWKEPWK